MESGIPDATRVAAWVRTRPPSAGTTRVVAVEGRSGAGKTRLGQALAAELGASLIGMDDLYPGWDGLLGGVHALRAWILEPLAAGATVVWRRWDWPAGRYGAPQTLPPGPDLVVEGVGSGAAGLTAYRCGLVWVDAPDDVRRRRALERDGETYAPHWERWARQEDAFYARHRVRERADLIVDGTSDPA